jgi:hypothetical protein
MNLGFIVNAETKEQSRQWMHNAFTNKLKKFKQTPVCQKADGNHFVEQERSADVEIHATRDYNNFTNAAKH